MLYYILLELLSVWQAINHKPTFRQIQSHLTVQNTTEGMGEKCNQCKNQVLVRYKKSDIINTVFRLYFSYSLVMLILREEVKYLRRVDVT